MRGRNRTICCLAALTVLTAGAPTAHAATPETNDTGGTTVIRPTPSSEKWSPATTVIPRKRLEAAGADAPSVLQEEAGLRVTRLGGLGAFSLLSVRGSTADQVRLYLDGIPLTSAEGGPVDLSTLPLGPLGSVHVYRGSAPVMYGSSAIGGTVDIRTRRLGERRLELELGGGSFWSRSARGFFGDGGETGSVALSFDYTGTEGNFGYPSDNGTAFDPSDDVRLERGNNRFNQVAGLLKARLEPAPGIRLTLLDLLTWSDNGLPGTGLFQTEEAQLQRLRNLLGARLEVLRMPVQLAVSGYVAFSRTRYDDPLSEIGLGGGSVVQESWVPGLDVALRAPLDLAEKGAWRLTPIVTAAYRLERFEPRGEATRLRHIVSAAAEVDLHARPLKTHLVASARYEGALGETEEIGGGATLPPDFHGVSWRAAIVQQSIPDTRLALSVGRNLRLPSLYELYGDNGYVVGNPDLRPEDGLTVELSAAHFATWVGDDDMVKFEVAGFVTWTDDLIQFVQNAQNIARPENVDTALLAGVEAGVGLDVVQHLRARGSLTWLYTENQSQIAARRGKRLPFRPEWAVFGQLEGYHDVSTDAVGELGLRVEVDYTAGNVLDNANLVQVPERVLLGIGAHAEFWRRQLRLDVSVRNLLSETVQDLAGFPLPGVSAYVSVRWTPELDD